MTKRRLVKVGLAVVVFVTAFSVGFAPAAQAAPIAPVAPLLVPEAAAVCVAGGPVTAVACGAVAVGVLGAGAWWAYNNQDTMAGWWDSLFTADGASEADPQTSATCVLRFSAATPPASGGPVDITGRGTNSPSDALSFSWQTYRAGSGNCQPGTNSDAYYARWACVNNGVVVWGGPYHTSYIVGGNSWMRGTVGSGSNWGCQQAGDQLAYLEIGTRVGGVYGPLVLWSAGGDWAKYREYTTTVTCKLPGGATATVTADSSAIVTAGPDQVSVPNCQDVIPGSYVQEVIIERSVTGQTTKKVVIHWKTKPGAEGDYAECLGSGKSCKLRVFYQGEQCDSTEVMCQDWWTRSRAGQPGYTCRWGPYTVPMSNCEPLRHLYKPGADTDPDTGLAVEPGAGPNPSASPGTGPAPLPTTGTNPNPRTNSEGGPNTDTEPGTVPVIPGTGVQPSDIGACLGEAWSWNPWNWVYVPVKCVLVWAWVPDAPALDAIRTEMETDWAGSDVGLFVDATLAVFEPLGSLGAAESGGCGGLTATVPLVEGFSESVTVLDSCTEPWSTYAPWVKGFMTMAVIVGGAYRLVQIVGAGFNWHAPSRAPEQLSLF